MTTSAVGNILWPIVLLGGMGAAIDFYIGRVGQKRVKDWLEIQWYLFHQIEWHNFSENEARCYISIADRIFGAKLISLRRLISTATIGFGAVFFFSLVTLFDGGSFAGLVLQLLNIKEDLFSAPLIWVAVDIVLLAVSISFTRWISLRVIDVSVSHSLGPLLFAVVLVVHYMLFVTWRPLVDALLQVFRVWMGMIPPIFLSYITGNPPRFQWSDVFSYAAKTLGETIFFSPNYNLSWSPFTLLGHIEGEFTHYSNDAAESKLSIFDAIYVGNAAHALLSYLANALRIVMGLILLGSFLLREWFGRVFSKVWARVVESDKPAFTVFLGGIGGLAGGINEVLKHF
jgi:hypothetical protein